jgi:hypothetical protein
MARKNKTKRVNKLGFKIKDVTEYLKVSTKNYEHRLKVGVSIRMLREGCGVSQQEVAVRLNMFQGNYSKIERGEWPGLSKPFIKKVMNSVMACVDAPTARARLAKE